MAITKSRHIRAAAVSISAFIVALTYADGIYKGEFLSGVCTCRSRLRAWRGGGTPRTGEVESTSSEAAPVSLLGLNITGERGVYRGSATSLRGLQRKRKGGGTQSPHVKLNEDCEESAEHTRKKMAEGLQNNL